MSRERRKVLAALLCAALAVPRSFAQVRVRRIAFLLENDYSFYGRHFDAFRAGMRELGYREGRDYVVERRTSRSELAMLAPLAAEVMRSRPDVVIAPTTAAALAARTASRDVPILIVNAGDPVASGLAQSLRRPGGNVTGLTSNSVELYGKRLDLLRQMVPGIARVGFVHNPDVQSDVSARRQLEADCAKIGLQLIAVPLQDASQVVPAFEALQRAGVQGLLVSNASTNTSHRRDIVEAAANGRLPAVYPNGVYAEVGGLVSYAADYPDLYRRVAAYVDRIFKGAKPGELPIEQPTRMELIANARTARALGIAIPASVLVRADEVID